MPHLYLIQPKVSVESITPQEAVRRRAEACQTITNDAVVHQLEAREFLEKLKLAGAMSAEA